MMHCIGWLLVAVVILVMRHVVNNTLLEVYLFRVGV